jgi:cellulose synthase/poly-beta-1,6-N-acetylglucosamine synthase-like glycosyltransferase
MPFWLSFWNPFAMGYFLITFNVYWFYKSFTLAISAIKSFLTLQAHVKVDWLKQAETLPDFDKLYHAIIIPEYKEPIHILKRTIDNLAKTEYPLDKLIIIVATEEKDADAQEITSIIHHAYAHTFGKLLVTAHPVIPGEVAGKSSNMAFAAKKLGEKLEEWEIDPHFVTVTSCDADALIHPKYFANVAVHFLKAEHKYALFFQGAILFYSNIWRIPLPNRLMNILGSIWNLASLSQQNRLINFSTYTLPFQTAKDVGYWGTDVIPEDYHMYFKVYFKKGEYLRTQPIFLPILVDAAESRGFIKTMVNHYEQSKRWAWGVSDIPYVVKGMITSTHINWIDRAKRLSGILEHHIFWPANWFLLTIGGIIPPLVNPEFSRTMFGFRLAQISSGILTLSTIFLLVVFYIDWKLKPPKPEHVKNWTLPFLYLQWFTLPIIAFFLSALPGLDAHTRLLLGKRLEYRVTEKV